MKLLFDHNLSPRLLRRLADLYPELAQLALLALLLIGIGTFCLVGFAILQQVVDNPSNLMRRGHGRLLWSFPCAHRPVAQDTLQQQAEQALLLAPLGVIPVGLAAGHGLDRLGIDERCIIP